jgi:hypothetical protein
MQNPDHALDGVKPDHIDPEHPVHLGLLGRELWGARVGASHPPEFDRAAIAEAEVCTIGLQRAVATCGCFYGSGEIED